MLRNVIDDYLKSVTEKEFFTLFPGLLEFWGFSDIHFTHGLTEYGKDFIAKKEGIQYAFQLKAGDIDSTSFRTIRLQVLQSYTNQISHPSYDGSLKNRMVLVATGRVKSICDVDISQFNTYLVEKMREEPLIVWDHEDLLHVLYDDTFDKYFESYLRNQDIISFLQMLSSIKEGNYNWISFEEYSRTWSGIGGSSIEKIRPFIETSIFSLFLKEKKDDYYMVILYICLYRFCKERCLGNEYFDTIKEEIKTICELILIDLDEIINEENAFISHLHLDNPMFDYPKYCFQKLEIISVGILLELIDKSSIKCIEIMIKRLKGTHYIISDNYAITVYFVTLVLIKYDRIELVNKYLTNSTVWLCNQITEYGTAPLAANEIEETEQILATYLTGLLEHSRKSSFTATVLLFCSYLTKNVELLFSMINDFKAVDTILQYFNIIDDESVWYYDTKTITESNDPYYLEKEGYNYSEGLKYLLEKSTITVSKEIMILSMMLLRDRFFPKDAWKIIENESA